MPYIDGETLRTELNREHQLGVEGAVKITTRAAVELLEPAAPPLRGGLVHALLGWALAEAGREEEARALLAEIAARPAPVPANTPLAWLLDGSELCYWGHGINDDVRHDLADWHRLERGLGAGGSATV